REEHGVHGESIWISVISVPQTSVVDGRSTRLRRHYRNAACGARLRPRSPMKHACLLVWALLVASPSFAASATTHLLHSPAMNRNQIVFSYAGDLWTVSRQGGTATRLTSGPGLESLPVFSPDGETIAFTGEYDGNIDVYTMPAAGGVPKRITYH